MSSAGSAAPARRPTSSRTALPALVGVTAIWGATFVVVKDAVERMPVTDFLAWRFIIGALAMTAVRPAALRRLPRSGRRAGALLGLALGAGYLAQTVGLQRTSPAVSGFITGMFVVFTPLLAAPLLRRPVGRPAWAAVLLATVGLALLSLRGWSFGSGEALTVLCAVCFALHIVGLGAWSASYDSYGLAAAQLLVVAASGLVLALPGGLTPPPDAGVWAALLVTGVLATALAFVVQTWAQAHLSPTRAAVTMTMEPVFAGLVAVVVAGDRLGWRQLGGAVLILTAMVLVETGPRPAAKRRAVPLGR